jgi:hypothetical protein
MFKLASLFVEIGADTGRLNAALAGVHARLLGMGGIGQKLSGGLHAATNTFLGLGALGPAALAATAAGVGAVAVGLAHCAFKAAELTESIAKVEQAFGSASPRILAMADELAAKFGAVKKDVLDIAGSLGLMLQGAGVGRGASAEMAEMLTRRAVDVKSFFEVPMEEAIARFQSGLSGEMEAVRRWGINLTETNVKRQAAALGFTGELDEAVKVLVRFKIMMEATSVAAGDADRSQGRLIGAWDQFTGHLSKLATDIGAEVVPMFTLLVRACDLAVKALLALDSAAAGRDASGRATAPDTAANEFGKWVRSFFVTDPAAPDKAKELLAIDAQRAAMARDVAADEAAGRANEAAARKKKADDEKFWMGGLAEYARHLQEGAFGPKKDAIPKDHLKSSRNIEQLLKDILNRLGRPMPAVVS